MHENTQEPLDRLPEPLTRLVREKWIAEGKARLVTRREVKECLTAPE